MKIYKVIQKICKIIIIVGLVLLPLELIYLYGMKNPDRLHIKHEYLGYTYYSSIFDPTFNEASAEAAFNTIIRNEPEYIFLLDKFYDDGYTLHFDDKFTYAWCTGDLLHSGDFAAAVIYDRNMTGIRCGMFVNYKNSFFSDKVFFHELSHYADYKAGQVSQTEGFRKIYEEEYENSTLALDDYYSDLREYFAEESSYFILEDSNKDGSRSLSYGTHEDAPKTFEYIKNVYEELRK